MMPTPPPLAATRPRTGPLPCARPRTCGAVWHCVGRATGLPPDPGWGRPRDIALALVCPPMGLRRRPANLLVMLRMLFVAYSLALVGIGVVTLILTTTPPPAR
jgi:hypothetical protein